MLISAIGFLATACITLYQGEAMLTVMFRSVSVFFVLFMAQSVLMALMLAFIDPDRASRTNDGESGSDPNTPGE